MGQPKPPRDSILICGLIAPLPADLARGRDWLAANFGPLDVLSDAWPFDFTEYYAAEMGRNLLRQFVSFAGRFEPQRLAQVKLATNDGERRLAGGEHRAVNLDPGYVMMSKLVLASTKDNAHRIYLSDGIYAEITLRFTKHHWEPYPWTYADYASGRYFPFFDAVRARLAALASDR